MDNQVYPSVAFGDTNYLVVWQGPYWVNNDIYGARVTLTGTVLDPGGIPISTGEGGQHHPSVSFDGNHYLVVWMDGRDVSFDIYGTRVSQSGDVLEPLGFTISTEENAQWNPSLTFGDTTYLVVWEDERGITSNIYGTRVVQSGEVLDTSGIIISTAGHSEQSPSIGFNNTNYLVVWEDSRNMDYYDIYGARVNQSGTILDPSGIGISICNESQHSPEVESNGFSYLVVWEDARSDTSEIYGTLVIPSGLVLNTHGVELSIEGHGQSPSIAYDGINYLTVWSDEHFIRGTRVDILCRVIDSSGINIAIGDTIRSSPSVAFGNDNYLVVWEATLFSVPSDSEFYTLIYGARVTPNGTVLDTQEILISMNGCSPRCPSVAFDGTNYFVVWSDYDINTEQNIYGTRMDETGTVLDTLGIPISTAMGTQISSSAIFDGTNYIVIWRDRRSNNWDLYGARVTTAGEVIDTFTVSTASYDESTANIAYGAGEQSFIVYSHYMGSPYKNERVFGRFYTSTGVEEEEELGLLQNIPNPFRSVTMIHYFVSGKSQQLISLNIYNLAGQLIQTLVNESQSPGEYVVNWDGQDETGKVVPTGIYFARLNTGSFSKNIKITIVR
ncbi:T9SS type A sorting domain-containing protein [candidate division WOR-3 bacterium]|nr:T9SS type A sorting domain-containing protein [candidate division WOR-3 bacterium]